MPDADEVLEHAAAQRPTGRLPAGEAARLLAARLVPQLPELLDRPDPGPIPGPPLEADE